MALWTTLASQDRAARLSYAGVQTSGQLRATQALGQLDSYADLMADEHPTVEVDAGLADAKRVLDDALTRMQDGASRLPRLVTCAVLLRRSNACVSRHEVAIRGVSTMLTTSLTLLETFSDGLTTSRQTPLTSCGPRRPRPSMSSGQLAPWRSFSSPPACSA